MTVTLTHCDFIESENFQEAGFFLSEWDEWDDTIVWVSSLSMMKNYCVERFEFWENVFKVWFSMLCLGLAAGCVLLLLNRWGWLFLSLWW